MTREEFDFSFIRLGYVGQVEVCKVYIKTLEQQIQKLQEENEHLKNMLQAHTKEK